MARGKQQTALSGHRGIAVAMLARAVRDAGGNGELAAEARAWLAGMDAHYLVALLCDSLALRFADAEWMMEQILR